jgi:hypothetical protein
MLQNIYWDKTNPGEKVWSLVSYRSCDLTTSACKFESLSAEVRMRSTNLGGTRAAKDEPHMLICYQQLLTATANSYLTLLS